MASQSIRELEPDWWIPTPNARANLGMCGFSQYCVDTYGRVYNIRTQQELKPFTDRRGYHNFTLWKDNGTRATVRAHRLVAMAFVPVPRSLMPKDGSYDDLQVNHIDMNYRNNYYKNLEWCSNEENSLATSMNRDTTAKNLHPNMARFICKMLAKGYRNKPLAAATGVSEFVIQNIKHRKTYTEYSKDFEFPDNKNAYRCLTPAMHQQQEKEIREFIAQESNSDHSEDRTISSPAVVEETISDLVPAATDVAAS